MNDLTKEVLKDENIPDSTEGSKILIKAMNKVIGQRDVSSQEAMHILMGYDSFDCSRLICKVDIRDTVEVTP